VPKNITYLLGAGASANALPVVKEMIPRMKLFIELCAKISSQTNSSLWEDQKIKEYQDLIVDAERLGSPDAVARKYHHLRKPRMVEKLKDLLSTYILWEQLNESSQQLKFNNNDETNVLIEELRKTFKNKLDIRYAVFFLAIYNGSRANDGLPQNINILTWNYDLQIEKALAELDDSYMIQLQERFKVFPFAELSILNSLQQSQGNPQEAKIIKLNGTASFSTRIQGSSIDVNRMELDEIIWDHFTEILLKDRKMNFTSSNLCFAWEDIDIVKQARKRAKNIIQNTEILVIIGYSFPDFNRPIDRDILQGFQGSKIYIQNPVVQSVETELRQFLNEPIEIITRRDPGKFIIPDEFYD